MKIVKLKNIDLYWDDGIVEHMSISPAMESVTIKTEIKLRR